MEETRIPYGDISCRVGLFSKTRLLNRKEHANEETHNDNGADADDGVGDE